MKVKITADSTCDLPQAFLDRYGIRIFPLYIVRDGVALRDGIDITPDDLYAYTKETGKLCGTAAGTVADYADGWRECLKDCDAVVHVAFSSELSVTCGNARLAAEDFDNVYVVDSLNLSTGYGHLVLDAAIMAENGASPQEIVAETERQVPKMDVSFVLNTLDFLRKGGRCTAVQALGANLLGIKPCIEVHEGKMGVAKSTAARSRPPTTSTSATACRAATTSTCGAFSSPTPACRTTCGSACGRPCWSASPSRRSTTTAPAAR